MNVDGGRAVSSPGGSNRPRWRPVARVRRSRLRGESAGARSERRDRDQRPARLSRSLPLGEQVRLCGGLIGTSFEPSSACVSPELGTPRGYQMSSTASSVHTVESIAARLERLPVNRVHYRLLVIHGFGWLFDAMDVGIITFVVAALAKEWSLTPAQIGLVGSSGLAGMFVGAGFGGYAADRWGRKAVFQTTLLIFALATALCAVAWDLGSMLAFRFLVGVGLGAELPVVASLLSEFIPASRRGRFVVWLESFWAYGWLAAALVAFLLIPQFGWRIAFLIGAVPAFYVWVVRRTLPESPRWHSNRGNYAEADRIVSDLERETERNTGRALPQVSVPAGTDVVRGKATLGELWSADYWRRTLMLWLLWFGLVAGYYGIFVWLPTLLMKAGHSMVNSFGYVVIVTIAQIPGYFSAAYLADRIGRRPVIVGYLLLSAASAFFFGRSTATSSLLVWACLMSFFNLGAWGGVYAYTPELYPTRLRTTGAGSAAAFGRIGGILAPFAVGTLLPKIGQEGVLAMNAGLLAMAAAAVAILGIETKGKRLEEIAQ